MVTCLDCHNLTRSWIPTSKPDMLFDQGWKCKATGQLFDMYYLIEKERQCTHYNKFRYVVEPFLDKDLKEEAKQEGNTLILQARQVKRPFRG